MMGEKIGSIWRRWDLHIHGPNTKLANSYHSGVATEEVWNRYIDFLENAPPQVYGITDYFSCDSQFLLIEKYRARLPDSKKVLFVNVEFRLSDAIDANNKNPDLHVIFDNDEAQCSQKQIQRFLVELKTKGDSSSGARICCSELATKNDFEAASVSFDDIKTALGEVFGMSKPYLLVFPAKNDGVKSTDVNSPRKLLLTEKIDNGCHIFFGDADSGEYFLKRDRYKTGESEPKPVVSGSDAHSFEDLERLEGNVVNFPPTWIKGDLTFRGLQQIGFEPASRVFIGLEPPVEQRKAQQPTKILTKLRISQVAGYDGANGHWFRKIDIPLNPELTAIIGNKGSGKSALVDIIGLLGESRLEEFFGFLSNASDNKKFKRRGFAENFEAEITWQSGKTVSKVLSQGVDRTKPETVRYLPQNYFEQLTNEIEIEKFRREIEDVVFSHVEETERLGAASFQALQDLMTLESKNETSALKVRLRQLNVEILGLESRADPQFLRALSSQLDAKREELVALEAAKPSEVVKPEVETDEQKTQVEQLERLAAVLVQLQTLETLTIDVIAQKKLRLQKLVTLTDSVQAIGLASATGKEELRPIAVELGLDIDIIIRTDVDITSIQAQGLTVKNEIRVLETDNAPQFSLDFNFSQCSSLPDLRSGQTYINEKVGGLREQLSTPERKYQAYLDKLAIWNRQKAAIQGTAPEPQPETILFLEGQIDFIKTNLLGEIEKARASRKEIVEKIYTSKKKILTFYVNLKSSVEEKLNVVRTAEFSVEINAAFVPSRNFIDSFLQLLKKNRRGPFYGASSSDPSVKLMEAEIKWDDFDSIYNFIESTLARMKGADAQGPFVFEDQINDPKELYNFLYSLEYFSPSYELRLGGKNLNELSPGEKGLLLLIFYLQLDKDTIPLVIDQPEDNLDNESIFSILANCIRQAKKTRQVILVTHNPNLAVGADAEQIVCVRLDKANNYKFSYDSGAIENPRINQRIIDVLEGSQPAFVKRRLKYHIA
ncbi:hypothetical protein DXT98_01360 [Agrobacterium sp. ICMP 7243]|nr:hypothetical protein DXT98_01360 [Agrobacterium sp. ICMP 7243]